MQWTGIKYLHVNVIIYQLKADGQMAKWHQIKMVVQSQKEGERQSSAFLVTVTKHTQELEMCYTPVSGQEENWI